MGLVIFILCDILVIPYIHLMLCKKLVWLEYDAKKTYHIPTNGDWMDTQWDYGGILILLPVVQVVVLIITFIKYCEQKSEYDEQFHHDDLWENKPLKR